MTETSLHIRPKNRLASAVCLCAAGMAAYIIFTAVSTFCRETDGLTLAKYLAAALLLCALAAGLSRFGRNETRHALCMLAVAFVIRYLFIRLIDTQPESDFALLYKAAKELAAGNNTLNSSPYFSTWAYQSGYVLFLAFFIRFFGAGLFFFKVMNCLLSTVTVLLVYLLARRMASAQGARSRLDLYALSGHDSLLFGSDGTAPLGNTAVIGRFSFHTAGKNAKAELRGRRWSRHNPVVFKCGPANSDRSCARPRGLRRCLLL